MTTSNEQINFRITNHVEISKLKNETFNAELNKLSSEVFKPSDTDEKIMNVYELCTNRMKQQLE